MFSAPRVRGSLQTILTAGALLATAMATSPARGQIIDFEAVPDPNCPTTGMLPDGTCAIDNDPISSEFYWQTPYGLVFGIDNNQGCVADAGIFPLLEAWGADGTDGFVSACGPGVYDTDRTTRQERLDNWFL